MHMLSCIQRRPAGHERRYCKKNGKIQARLKSPGASKVMSSPAFTISTTDSKSESVHSPNTKYIVLERAYRVRL
jgi:hypothetical protein